MFGKVISPVPVDAAPPPHHPAPVHPLAVPPPEGAGTLAPHNLIYIIDINWVRRKSIRG